MELNSSNYRLYIDNLSTGVVAYAPDTTILYCNKKAQELLSLSVDQIQGQTSLNPQWNFIRENGTILPHDEFPIARAIRSDSEFVDYVIGIICTKNPDVTWVSCNSNRILYADGTLDHVLISFIDITKRKLAEEALLRSETQLRTLVDTIPDLIWLKDQDGNYLNCNRTFERFFGASKNAIIGKSDHDFVDRDLADFFRKNDRKAMTANRSRVNEEELTFAEDGYCGLFETIKTPMRDSAGNLVGVLGIARDISDRKSAEISLKVNEQRYKSAQRMGKVGNWEYNLLTETLWSSEQAKSIYGFDPERKKITIDEVESCITDRENVHQALVDLIEKGKPYNLELEIRPINSPDKKIIKSIAEIVNNESGLPTKVIGVTQDITEKKKAEQEKEELILELREALRKVNKLKSLLPICQYCKKIRDDKGYWNQLESYILEHTETKFSHSICTECLEKYYPDMDLDDD